MAKPYKICLIKFFLMPWYVIYTKSNSERKVAKYLQDKGIEVYCPLIETVKQWSDREKKVSLPLFRSYLFVYLNDYKQENIIVLNTQGVVRFLWWLGKPGLVQDNEIVQIKKFLNENKNNEIFLENDIKPGDSINIINGFFNGHTGKVLSKRGKRFVLELNSLACRLIAIVPSKDLECKSNSFCFIQ